MADTASASAPSSPSPLPGDLVDDQGKLIIGVVLNLLEESREEVGRKESAAKRPKKRQRTKREGSGTLKSLRFEQRENRQTPFLQSVRQAFQVYTRWLSGLKATSERKGSEEDEERDEIETTAAHDEVVNYETLHRLRKTVQPKLRFEGTGKEIPIYDSIGANESEDPVTATCDVWDNHTINIPPNTRWLSSDHKDLRLHTSKLGGSFDFVLMDPPWENACARRAQHYSTLPSAELLKLPVEKLLSKENGIVGIWMTSREKIWRFVDQTLLPKWGLKPLTHWHWLKVIPELERVDTKSEHIRLPYETLMICTNTQMSEETALALDQRIPKNLVIIASRSQHSRKPYLGGLFSRFLGDMAGDESPSNRMELFARDLREGWTSWGLEPLKFQTVPDRQFQ